MTLTTIEVLVRASKGIRTTSYENGLATYEHPGRQKWMDYCWALTRGGVTPPKNLEDKWASNKFATYTIPKHSSLYEIKEFRCLPYTTTRTKRSSIPYGKYSLVFTLSTPAGDTTYREFRYGFTENKSDNTVSSFHGYIKANSVEGTRTVFDREIRIYANREQAKAVVDMLKPFKYKVLYIELDTKPVSELFYGKFRYRIEVSDKYEVNKLPPPDGPTHMTCVSYRKWYMYTNDENFVVLTRLHCWNVTEKFPVN